MPETEQPAIPRSTPRSTKLRIPVQKQQLVQAMLSEHITHRNITEATGICSTTIQKIKRQELATSEHAEKIKKGLRNRWAILADNSLNSLSNEKLTEASAKDLAYIASKATEMAGLSPPSIIETYSKSMQTFLVQDTPPQVVGTETVVKTVVSPITDNS